MADVGLLILKALAAAFSLAMIFSPALDMRRLRQQKHTGEMALMPLVGLWISCHMWMVYGLITSDIFPLFITYLVGVVASVTYIVIYYHYTKEKGYARKVVLSAALIIAIITAYTILGKAGVTNQSSDDVNQTIGYVTAFGSVALYTSPFETIRRVLKTKSGASIPVLMCACGCVSNSLWVIYGLVEDDMFVFGLGVFCVTFALVQVVLFFVYHPSKQQQQQVQEGSGAVGALEGGVVFEDANKFELAIAVESPCFEAMKSPLAPLK